MKMRIACLSLSILAALVFLAVPAPAQDTKDTVPAAVAAPVSEQVNNVMASEELSIYGEVQTVDADGQTITVQYYDYDTDEEKTSEIMTGKDTKLDNAASIADIKKGDWVDVTYTANSGKNVAKVVSVEKEEPAQDENAPAAEE